MPTGTRTSVHADFFDSEQALVDFIDGKTPITVLMSNSTYDFTNINIPTGVTFVGVGFQWNGSASNGGFGDGSVITGNPTQSLGTAGNKFQGVVFNGGFTVRKQYTVFDHCGFTGSAGLVFDFESGSAAPFSGTVDRCLFRGITATCIELKGQANANVIQNSTILVATGQRGVVASKQGSDMPTTTSIIGCDIEQASGVTSIGSFVYGDFINLHFQGNYLDASKPTFTDGADIVLSSDSRNCRIWLPNADGDTYTYAGLRHIFYAGGGQGTRYIGGGTTDLADFSGIPEMIITAGTTSALTMPPIQNGYGDPFTIVCERSAGTTLTAASGETINGSNTLALSNGEAYEFYTLYAGTAVTDWKAKRLW